MSDSGGALFPTDVYLVDIVRAVNASDRVVPVTLLIGGSIVTGRIASLRRFVELHAKAFSAYTTVMTDPPDDPQLIFLEVAQVNGRSVDWLRIRIASVDAWRLGTT